MNSNNKGSWFSVAHLVVLCVMIVTLFGFGVHASFGAAITNTRSVSVSSKTTQTSSVTDAVGRFFVQSGVTSFFDPKIRKPDLIKSFLTQQATKKLRENDAFIKEYKGQHVSKNKLSFDVSSFVPYMLAQVNGGYNATPDASIVLSRFDQDRQYNYEHPAPAVCDQDHARWCAYRFGEFTNAYLLDINDLTVATSNIFSTGPVLSGMCPTTKEEYTYSDFKPSPKALYKTSCTPPDNLPYATTSDSLPPNINTTFTNGYISYKTGDWYPTPDFTVTDIGITERSRAVLRYNGARGKYIYYIRATADHVYVKDYNEGVQPNFVAKTVPCSQLGVGNAGGLPKSCIFKKVVTGNGAVSEYDITPSAPVPYYQYNLSVADVKVPFFRRPTVVKVIKFCINRGISFACEAAIPGGPLAHVPISYIVQKTIPLDAIFPSNPTDKVYVFPPLPPDLLPRPSSFNKYLDTASQLAQVGGSVDTSIARKVVIEGSDFATDVPYWIEISNDKFSYQLSDVWSVDGRGITFSMPDDAYIPPGTYSMRISPDDSDWSDPIQFIVEPVAGVVNVKGTITDASTGKIITLSPSQFSVSVTGSTGASLSINKSATSTFELNNLPAGTYDFSSNVYGHVGSTTLIITSADQAYPHTVNITIPISTTPSPTTSGTPSLTVISPNGGETFAAGAPIMVSWSSVNIPASAKVQVSVSGPSSYSNYYPNTGSATINLPTPVNYVAGTTYKFTVTYRADSQSTTVTASDQSNSTFTITPPQPVTTTPPVSTVSPTPTSTIPVVSIPSTVGSSVHIISPNGGETLSRGTTQNITWSNSGTSTQVLIFIQPYNPASPCTEVACPGFSFIASGAPNNGLYAWKVGRAQVALSDGNYMVGVCPMPSNVKTGCDLSDSYVTIVTPSTQGASVWDALVRLLKGN